MNKPNAYLGVHDITIVELSTQFQEAVLDSIEDQPVLVTPEDLYFMLELVLDNGLPYELSWPADDIQTVTDCFGVRTEALLDRNPYALLGLRGKGHFYCLQLSKNGPKIGPICSLVKKEP